MTTPQSISAPGSSNVRLTPKQVDTWLTSWHEYPVFREILLSPLLSEKEKTAACEAEMALCFSDLQGATAQYRGKLYTIPESVKPRVQLTQLSLFKGRATLGKYWRVLLPLARKPGCRPHDYHWIPILTDSRLQFLELPESRLAHPFWTTSILNLYGTTYSCTIANSLFTVPADIRLRMIQQVATEFEQSTLWPSRWSSTWLDCAPYLFCAVHPTDLQSLRFQPLALGPTHKMWSTHNKQTLSIGGTHPVVTESHFLHELRRIAWAWTIALRSVYETRFFPKPVWCLQKDNAHRAYEPFTLHAMRHSLHINLVLETPDLQSILACAPPTEELVGSHYELTPNSHQMRKVIPFHLRPKNGRDTYWQQSGKALHHDKLTPFTISLPYPKEPVIPTGPQDLPNLATTVWQRPFGTKLILSAIYPPSSKEDSLLC